MDRLETVADLARLDLDRQERAGVPEIVFAEGKTDAQLFAIADALVGSSGRAVISRLAAGRAEGLAAHLGDGVTVETRAEGRLARISRPDSEVTATGAAIGLLAAGTSDIPVAEEARLVAEEMGCRVLHFYDVGVAGLHRLIEPLRQIGEARVACVVAVAGMDGAMPTLVKSLVPLPVIGVPTSVGYGLGAGGKAALMTMLQSCTPGLVVVNIDNGVGAGASAALIANATVHAPEKGDD